MPETLTITEYLETAEFEAGPLLDVRSPKEFAKAHIPGAINLPVFEDEERHVIGTMYKQVGRDQAVRKGLEIIGPKMRNLVERVDKFAGGKKLCVHCWRGGMRSQSMAWLLETSGYPVSVIEGGYKAYRQHVLDYLGQPFDLVVLGGRTGSGKTDLLKGIAGLGEQVIDLEGLAHHKGSAFGHLLEAPQPSTEQFENNLFEKLTSLDTHRRIWVEDESHSIGRIYIPMAFYEQMKAAPVIVADLDTEARVERLVADYAEAPDEALRAALDQIKKRLGFNNHKTAYEALAQKDYATVARIALRYYDKAYDYGLEKKRGPLVDRISWDGKNVELAARNLLTAIETTYTENSTA